MSASVSYPDFVRRLFNISGDPSKDFSHAILGVATEIFEYLAAPDLVNAIEELGDLGFYGQAADQVVGDILAGTPFSLEDVMMEAADAAGEILGKVDPLAELRFLINELLDHAKRWLGYGKEPASLPGVLADVHTAILVARELGRVPARSTFPMGWTHIQAVNMAKLLKRYPGGEFDQFRALQRDLGAERATLEAAALG